MAVGSEKYEAALRLVESTLIALNAAHEATFERPHDEHVEKALQAALSSNIEAQSALIKALRDE